MDRIANAQAARGGNRFVGRRLLPILKSAGFARLDIEPMSANSEAEGIDPFLHQMDPRRLTPLLRAGLMSQQEVEKLVRQRTDFLALDPFVMFVLLMAVGR